MRATGTPHTHPHTHTHVTSKVLIVWRLKVKTRVPSKGWREKRQERGEVGNRKIDLHSQRMKEQLQDA